MFFNIVDSITNWLWGPPMLIILGLGGLYLTIRLGFFQFRYFGFIMKSKWNEIRSGKKVNGVSGFQALTAAMASTLGPGNIVGVPVAIAYGGPGALFWMWIVGLNSACVKFCEVTLAVKYREKNEKGEYIGGPMKYLAKCFSKPWLGTFYSVIVAFGCIPLLGNQAASIGEMATTIHIPVIVTGIVLMLLAGLVVIGGITQIVKVTEKFVPIMGSFYVIGCLVVILANASQIIPVFGAIFADAFTGTAAVGGFAGSTLAAAFRWGLARGTGSNDAGNGLAAIAHASADVDNPVQQGLWGVVEVVLDTLVVCTMTGLVVLTSGVWKVVDASSAATMPSIAFQNLFGSSIGGGIVTLALALFVFSSVIVIVYFGEKQMENLFGLKAAKIAKFAYLLFIPIGALGGVDLLVRVLDLTVAFFIIPNMIGLFIKVKEIKELKDDFFSNPKLYPKAKAKAE